MEVNRKTVVAGDVTLFEFTGYRTNSVVVKNETSGSILFCDGSFDASKAAHIPPFTWQHFNVAVDYGVDGAKFYIKAEVAGDIEIDFGSSGMGTLFGPAFNLAGMIPHSLTFDAGKDTTLTAELTRKHGETLDLDAPVALTSGATVFAGDIIVFTATTSEDGHHVVLTINGEEAELSDDSATHTVKGETAAQTELVKDEEPEEEE